jgi:hypothetical protein
MTLDLSKQADQLFISNLTSKSLRLPMMGIVHLKNIPSSHPNLADFLTSSLPIDLKELVLDGDVSNWTNKLSDSLAKRNIRSVRFFNGELNKGKVTINFRCGRCVKKRKDSVVRRVKLWLRPIRGEKFFKRKIQSRRNSYETSQTVSWFF